MPFESLGQALPSNLDRPRMGSPHSVVIWTSPLLATGPVMAEFNFMSQESLLEFKFEVQRARAS